MILSSFSSFFLSPFFLKTYEKGIVLGCKKKKKSFLFCDAVQKSMFRQKKIAVQKLMFWLKVIE